MWFRYVIVVICLATYLPLIAGHITLTPCEDVYIQTYGGGEGWNVFMKFDISSVPRGKTIDSAFLKVYVRSIHGNWDGDVNFWNVHNQTWTEGDSAIKIWNSPTSDSLTQWAGFGMNIGWTKSITMRPIFLEDYNAGNLYCTIKMKDLDDLTNSVPSYVMPVDSPDSLGLGAWWPLRHYICFYPHEHIDSVPKLVIYSKEFGIEVEDEPEPYAILHNYPNPFSHRTMIELRVKSSELRELKLEIYDLCGRLVKSFSLPPNPLSTTTVVEWDGTDTMGNKLCSGIYFYRVGKSINRLILVR